VAGGGNEEGMGGVVGKRVGEGLAGGRAERRTMHGKWQEEGMKKEWGEW
jgi:hypothetical protein